MRGNIRQELSRRDFLRLTVGAAIMCILPGCRHVAPSLTAPEVGAWINTERYKKIGPWRIGRSGRGDITAWMVMFSAHIEYGVKEKYRDRVKDYLCTSANWDPNKQIEDIRVLLKEGIDLLLIDPLDSAVVATGVKEAMDAGVPVILASTHVQGAPYVSLVSMNEEERGAMCADWLCRLITAGRVAIFISNPSASDSKSWLKAIRHRLSSQPKIHETIIAYCPWSSVEAKKVAASSLRGAGSIDGVIVNNGVVGCGVVQAFVELGSKIPPIAGGDDWNGWLRVAKEYKLRFLGLSGGANLGLQCVDLAAQVLAGKPVLRYVEFPYQIFDESQLSSYYRPDLSDHYWAVNDLPEPWIERMFRL